MSNALTYTSIRNTIKDTNNYFIKYGADLEWGDKTKLKSIYSVDGKLTEEGELDKLLSETTIKRACCLGKENLYVRIPTPAGKIYNPDDEAMEKKFNYVDKLVKIPKSMCPKLVPGYSKDSPQCDAFYNVYCDNIIKNFKKLKNKSVITTRENQKFSGPPRTRRNLATIIT